MRRSYLDYAMSVIVGRALPDVRDGLKPVHRRVLYGMWEQSNLHNKPYKKSARIVGDVMGKYHPHGDSAIYDTVVRLAQDFSMRHPLVDGQGNFGSIDGDAPAAMRYTEIRMQRLAEEMIGDDIDKETVNWVPNYDGSLEEPVVLPSKFPNLLVNGSEGIAVGMATKIPPHNLGEVIDATVAMIRNPAIGFDELMRHLPGPDFPTAGSIHGRGGIVQAYRTGRGSIQIRAKAEIEKMKGDREQIVVTELPYQVNKARLIEKIAELVRDKKIDGISNLRDESDREGMRVVIELKRGEVAQVVLNNLYAQTAMQVTFGIIVLCLVDGRPRVLDLRELLSQFLLFRKQVVVRRTRFELRKAEERAHLLEGLAIAVADIDQVIAIIRSSRDPKEAKDRLTREVSANRVALDNLLYERKDPVPDLAAHPEALVRLSEIQAQAILDLRLQRLTGLERDKIFAEWRDVLALIARLKEILASEKLILDIIEGELLDIRKRFANPRRTEIVAEEGDLTIEELIAEEEMVVTVSRGGYIKRSPLSIYRAQRRGGKGRTGMATKEEDVVEHLFAASTHDFLLVFTNKGRVHQIRVYGLPSIGPASRGKAIVNLLPVGEGELPAAFLTTREFPEDRFLVFATKDGTVKKTPLAAYSNIRSGGIIAINLEEGDELLSVRMSRGDQEVFLGTHQGMAIRFEEGDVRATGRDTTGVKGIELRKDEDQVVEMDVLEADHEILTVTEKGFGKRTAITEYRLQGRGGSGVINVRITEKNGPVAGIKSVTNEDQVLLITEQGSLIRIKVSGIRETGRDAQGVRLIDVGEGDRVVAVAKLAERDDEEPSDEGEEGSAPEEAAAPTPAPEPGEPTN
jgi:DNA gyrase subunit A